VAEGQHIMAGGQGAYERPIREGETVYVLTDLVEGPVYSQSLFPLMKEQIVKIVSETTAQIVRDMAPDIVERVIREEIEKLKREND